MLNKIIQANEQIKKVKDYVVSNSDALHYMNLKLHDAIYYGCTQAKNDLPLLAKQDKISDLFYEFCEDNYNMFVEDLQIMHGIDFESMKNQVGRTSSFYLHDKEIFNPNRSIFGNNFDDYIGMVMNEFYDYNLKIEDYFDDNECIKINELIRDLGDKDKFSSLDYFKEFINDELDYIINDMYNDVENYLKDIIIVYTKIRDFKENQIEYFKEFLTNCEEDLKEEQEQELKQLKEYKNKLNNIFDKIRYIITDEEMNYLKKQLTK